MSFTLVLLKAAAFRRRRLGERLAAVGAARPAAIEEQRHLARREAKVRQEGAVDAAGALAVPLKVAVGPAVGRGGGVGAATSLPAAKASSVSTGSAFKLAVASRSAL